MKKADGFQQSKIQIFSYMKHDSTAWFAMSLNVDYSLAPPQVSTEASCFQNSHELFSVQVKGEAKIIQ